MKSKNISLYEDKHPKTSRKGLGFRDKVKAIDTINKIKNENIVYQFQVINTMFNRARFHPHQTKDMREAMNIFKIWLKKYKNNKLIY
jgi:hypothetical protein